MNRSKYRMWHVSFVPMGYIWFQGSDKPTFSFMRVVLRRYSAIEGGWIYARLGTRKLGDYTR